MKVTTRLRYTALLSVVMLAAGTAAELSAQAPAAPTNVRVLATGSSSVRTGIWIGKSELATLPMSGTAWTEVKAAADSSWTVQSIETQSSQVFNVQAMAGALVYARLAPLSSAGAYRAKVAEAIRDVIARPDDSSATATAPNRNLGTWAISADLIDLRTYDATLDSQFRAWLKHKIDYRYASSPSTIRTQVARANNQGAWACFATVAAGLYLGDTAMVNTVATRMRRWLGDTSVAYTLDWDSDQSWQMSPSSPSRWVGINPKGATRDGNFFDGIQPDDQRRGTPYTYSPSNFPNDFSSVRYNEVSLAAVMGAVVMLQRAGHGDLVGASDQAMLRAARWIKYAADNYPDKGYVYFTGFHEAARPIVNYLYGAGMPEARSRNQMDGREFGYAWTYWTHAGRRF